MARRSLRPHLNQIRGWVRQGRTDAWIAHQLEATVQQIESFKREQGLVADDEGEGAAAAGVDFDEEIDLRAEDDAAIAAELEAEAEAAAAAAEAAEAETAAAAAAAAAAEAARAAARDDEEDDGDDDEDRKPRRRSRRGGRTRRKPASAVLEGTFDHGDEGYGLWLDPAVVDDPVYAEHWAGHRPVEITVEEDQIVIRRAGPGDDEDD